MYSVRHELQRSADAGALAGASRWIEPGSAWTSNFSDQVMVESRERAKDYATKDKVATTPLDRLTEVAVYFPSQDRIRVTTQRTAPLFFARVLGTGQPGDQRDSGCRGGRGRDRSQVPETVGDPRSMGSMINGDGRYTSADGPAPDNLDLVPLGTKIIIKIAEPFT